MKLRHLFLAAIVAIGMMACNNEDVPQVKGEAKGALSVKVVPGSNSSTRAIDLSEADAVNKPGLTAESTVNKTQVWVFAGSTLDGYKEANGDFVEDISVSTGTRDIIIIVNGGSLGLDGNSAKADILIAKATAPVNIGTNGLLMTSEVITKVLKPGYNYLGKAAATNKPNTDWDHNVLDSDPIEVTRVNARVAIAGVTVNVPTGADVVFDKLTDVQVAMFNVPKESKIFGAAAGLAIDANYLFGAEWPSTQSSYVNVAGNETASFLEATVADTPIGLAQAPYFYVNENTAGDLGEQMLIVLRGKPMLGTTAIPAAPGLYTDAQGYTYYPVWVNANRAGYNYTGDNTKDSKIRRNTQYNIYLTVTKIGNPTIDPVEDAFLDVLVNVKEWEVVKQNVEW